VKAISGYELVAISATGGGIREKNSLLTEALIVNTIM
jgi:hypothetical protein